MKALTLHQPHASLVALRFKPIETRSWSTKYRGPLAIHAGLSIGRRPLGSWWWVNTENGHVLWSEGGRDHPRSEPMPLGAIVATCELADVVPIVHGGEEGAVRRVENYDDSALWLSEPEIEDENGDTWGEEDTREVTDQQPYGDFTPGRYAWLLEDIRPADPPVPCRGFQGLWNVPDDVLAQMEGVRA